MAGRGRSLVLPAWMTEGGAVAEKAAATVSARPVEEPPAPRREEQFQSVPSASTVPDRMRSRERSPSNSRQPRGEVGGDLHSDSGAPFKERGGERDRSRERSSRSSSSWRSSRRPPRKNNFDVMPDGSLASGPTPLAQGQFPPPPPPAPPGQSVGGNGMGFNLPTLPTGGHGGGTMSLAGAGIDMQATKHARRLYVGGTPPGATDNDILAFFSGVVAKCAPPAYISGNPTPVLTVYLNTEKSFAFVEFSSIELTTACLALDGVSYTGARSTMGIPAGAAGGAPCILRIRRPNDYRVELVPPANRAAAPLDLTCIGVIATSVPDGPNKIFFGGLPTSLNEDQVKELLATFGKLKAFHLVRDPGSTLTKGYGFCEYADTSLTQIAISGLNGLDVMGKSITVKSSNAAIAAGAAPAPSVNLAAMVGPGAGVTQTQNPYGNVVLPGAVPLGTDIANQPPTKILKLKNMVSAAELQDDAEHADILDDVRTECSQYGGPNAVTGVVIPRSKEGFPPSTEGSVFVAFSDVGVARVAAMALSGRKFGNNVVVVDYYDEAKYQQRVLDA